MAPRCAQDEARDALSRMAFALEGSDRFVRALHAEPGAGLGRVGVPSAGVGQSLVWNRDRSQCLVLEGELFDTGSLEQRLTGEPPRSQAELVLRLYERHGTEVLPDLNGAFSAALWDARRRELVVFNDRLGLHPIYYAQAGEDFLFASGVRAVVADGRVDRTVDRAAIAQFLVYDHALDDRTLLEDVRLLPQASVLHVRDGRLSIRPYWTLRYPDVYEARSEEAYVEEFMHHLRRAVARQQPDRRRAAVMLSGGLDSRMLLALLCADRATTGALTFGIPGCDDARVAAEVAARIGAKHHFFELKSDWLVHRAEEAVRATDGLGNVVNLHVAATIDQQSRHAEVVYKGFLADALFGFALKRQMWADYEPDVAFRVHQGVHSSQGTLIYDADQQRQLFSAATQARIGDAVCGAYANGMRRAGVAQLGVQRLYFDLTQRVPRMTLNGVEAARAQVIVRLPFCDNDLLDFGVRVPPGFLFERHLQKVAFARHFPDLAGIPIAGTGRPLRACARDLAIQARGLLAWHLRHRGLAWLAPREQRPYKDYDGWFRGELRSWLEGILLDRRTLDRGYVQPEFVRRLVSEHMAGARHAVRLGALLTVELWHRQFID